MTVAVPRALWERRWVPAASIKTLLVCRSKAEEWMILSGRLVGL